MNITMDFYEACRYGHLDIIKTMIESGIDIHAGDDSVLISRSLVKVNSNIQLISILYK